MYCSECKLRVADDSITVCPVCQGPLQPDAVNEEAFNDVADKTESAAPDVQVEDKFGVYESPGQELDFNPEKLGLEPSVQKDPADEDEDIQVLADLWEEENVDADLEGVLAEAFSLDEANEESDVEDDLDFEEGDLDPGKGLDLEKPAALPAQPPVAASTPNRSPLLLLLLLIVIGAGGGFWFYSQNLKSTPGQRVVRSLSKPQPAKPAPLPPVQEERVLAEKATTTEPVAEAVESLADDKAVKLETAVPVQSEALVEVSDLKDEGLKVPTSGAAVAQVPPAVASEELKASETLVASLATGVEEKKPAPEKVLAEGGAKAVVETKPQVSSPASASQEEVGKSSPKTVKAAVVNKTEVSLMSPYAIHVGSFKSRKRADRQLAMLQGKGFAAYQVEVDLKATGVWQRVMIPGGNTRKEAKVVQKKLAELFPKEDSLILKIKK